MIGPPGIPKYNRRIFSFKPTSAQQAQERREAWKWLTGLYIAGVLAHFSHHMAIDLPADGVDPSLDAAITSAPTSLAWPADLLHTLMDRS